MSKELQKFGTPINIFLLEAIKFTYQRLEKPSIATNFLYLLSYIKECFELAYLLNYFCIFLPSPSSSDQQNKNFLKYLENLQSSKLTENLDELKNIYEQIFKQLYQIYCLDNKNKKYLPIFGYLLGDNKLRKFCQQISNPLIQSQEEEIIELIELANTKLEFPDEVEQKLRMGKKFAQGSFSTIYKGYIDNQKYAFKELKQDNYCDQDMSSKNEIDLHWEAIKDSKCNQIVTLIGVIDSVFFKTPIMVLEFAKTDLLEFLSNNTVTNDLKFKITFDIVKALYYLHLVAHIFHRDLKIQNVLISHNNNAQLCDFGLATKFNHAGQIFKAILGSKEYVAPEILEEIEKKEDERHGYQLSAEIYSFAVCIWEIYHKESYWCNLSEQIGDYKNKVINGERPKINSDAKPELKELIMQCWHADPNQRPDIKQIYHTFENNKNLFEPLPQP